MFLVKKFKIILLIVIFIFMLLIFTDIYLLLLHPLDTGVYQNKKFGDIILVLGGGLKKKNEIGVSTAERLELASSIYSKRKMKILVSDGSLYRKSPAIKMYKDFLIKRGVSPEHIILEGKSQTTYENFIYTRDIVNREKSNEVIVCTSPYHQKRSGIIIDKLSYKKYIVAKMDRSEIYQSESIKQRIRNLKLIVREYFAMLKFKLFKK